jgi:hypothetical protein
MNKDIGLIEVDPTASVVVREGDEPDARWLQLTFGPKFFHVESPSVIDIMANWTPTELFRVLETAAKMGTKCTWRQDDEGNWFADAPCIGSGVFDLGGPVDNDMHFCPTCGRPLEAVPYKNEEVDDE